jgi:hypothetical protein
MVFQLTLDVNGKQKTFLTLASDTEEAVKKVRRYCEDQKTNSKMPESKILTCAPKPALTFVEDAEDK